MSKLQRNARCPCGSGKKFKHCCSLGPGPGAIDRPVAGLDAAQRTASLIREAHALLMQGRVAEAVVGFQTVVDGDPAVPEAWANLANAFDAAGRRDDAIAAYRHALTLRPGFAEVHNNLGLSLQAMGRHADAAACYRQALGLKPDYVAAHFNLGLSLQAQQHHAEAAASYRQVLAIQPGNAQASSNLGVALEERGELEAALAAYRRAVELDPSLVAARSRLDGALARLVPSWHVPMMNDIPRNTAYHRALQSAITPASTVFEIGTGSGLLAMMAAREGAAAVTSCEAQPMIAAAARRIVAANGLENRIRLLAKGSMAVEPGVDMAEPADILVSEIFSSELLGERVLSSIEDAKRRLLKADARVIPAVGSIMVGLFSGEDIQLNLRVDEVMGFDLSGFNALVPQRQTIARTDLDVELLSDGMEAFRFDFQRESAWSAEQKTLRIPVRTAGHCLGIVQWMRLEMDSETRFENHPAVRAPASSWTRCVHLLAEPLALKSGDTVVVDAMHNRVCPWFQIRGVA